MRIKRFMTTVLTGVVAMAGLSGCNSVPREDYDAAVAESIQLRNELASERERLAAANARSSDLEQDLLAARGEIDRLGTRQGSSTGFEGIEGTTVSGRGRDIVVGVAGDVLFDPGSITLKRAARTSLDQIASVLNSQYAGKQIRIEGHTDGDPIVKSEWKTNERLSAERAMAVEAYLAGRGVSADRMYAAAYGAAVPKGTKASSRRVEIVILDG
ncbi:MAG: OmpA/MotB family protein [Phycisphaerales bacterium]